MKTEKDLGIPVNRHTGFAISTKSGDVANEIDEAARESLFSGLCDELKQGYPELYASVFDDENDNSQKTKVLSYAWQLYKVDVALRMGIHLPGRNLPKSLWENEQVKSVVQ